MGYVCGWGGLENRIEFCCGNDRENDDIEHR
jgi:hypothetical protein